MLTISPVSAWNYNKGSRSYHVLVSSSFSAGSDNTTQLSRWRRHASLHCTGQDKLLRGKLYTRFSCRAYASAASQKKRTGKQNLMEVNGGDQSYSPRRHHFLWYGELRFIQREMDVDFACYDGKHQFWGSFAKLQATHNLKSLVSC